MSYCKSCAVNGTEVCNHCLGSEGCVPTRYIPVKTAIPTTEMETLPLTKGDRHQEICKKLNDIYRRKNQDYGNSFDILFDKYGELSALIRLEDKLLRFEQLINSPAQVKDESKIDTALDAANYWIMVAMKLMEQQKR